MITSLHIKNFRGISELRLTDLGQVNVIVGRNNVGKSSILEAISIALGAVNQDTAVLKEILNRVLKWRGWLKRASVYSLFNTPSTPIELTFVTNNTPFSARFMYPSYLPQAIEKEFGIKFDSETLKNMLSESVEIVPVQIKAGSFSRGALILISENGAITITTSNDELYPIEFPVEFVTPYDMNTPGFIEEVFSKAFKVKSYYKALEIIQEAYPEVEGLSPVPEDGSVLMYVDIKHVPKSIPYYSMGDGFKFLSMIAFLVSSTKNGYLLIDSAEAFHHPRSLEVMVRALIKGAKENNVQVFLTTHSLEFIDTILEYGIEEGVNGRIIYIKQEKGELVHSIETFENAKELREILGIDLRG
ncbi:ATP/GTP-binding protein [Pyrococcus kukulkanii]|uniref:AAA family ATPase n=1 Tax=Pyrococcus kukulkanii TaxID=1609559 RepID=UPI003565EFBA